MCGKAILASKNKKTQEGHGHAIFCVDLEAATGVTSLLRLGYGNAWLVARALLGLIGFKVEEPANNECKLSSGCRCWETCAGTALPWT